MATNPYYQRAFNSLAGVLARARQMINEFQLIQTGFDRIGDVQGATKYQLACSDLTSDLQVNASAAYFRVQRAFNVVGVRASLLTASSSGEVQVTVTVNGAALLSGALRIDASEKTSVTAAVQPTLLITEIPDDAEVLIAITQPGTGAKGLIVSLIGTLDEFLPVP